MMLSREEGGLEDYARSGFGVVCLGFGGDFTCGL